MRPEARIEREIVEYCHARGFECLKLTLAGRRGFPDRTVLIPGVGALFVEIKAERGRPSRHQLDWLDRLNALGFKAVLVRSCREFHAIVELFLQENGVGNVSSP